MGCGIGTWLRPFKELVPGVKIMGLDGEYNRDRLLIEPGEFIGCDLEERLPEFPSKFDLAMTLEVAEHLSPERGTSFVSDLVRLSDVVLFSAAWPGQGGTEHINEQWHEYWVKLFADEGYIPLDCLRPRIMNEGLIELWYRVNTLLFVSESALRNMRCFEWTDWRTLQERYHHYLADSGMFFHRHARKIAALDHSAFLTSLKRLFKRF